MQIEIGFNSAPDRHWRSYYCAATAFHVRPSPGHSLCVASPPDGRFLLPREAAMHTYQELAQDIPKEYEALKESAHRFAAEILRPASIELDRMADPRDVIALDSPLRRVFKKGYELGYHVASLPVESGGHGLRGLGSHILIEELSWGAVDLALSL